MDGILRVPHIRAGVDGPVAYARGGQLWVFAGSTYPASALLILHRHAPGSEVHINALLCVLPRRLLATMLARFDGRDTAAIGHWTGWQLRSRTGHLLLTGRIKLYRLNASEAHRIYDRDDPLFTATDDIPRHPHSRPRSVHEQRLAVAEALARVLLARWKEKTAADRAYWNASGLGRVGQSLEHVGDSVIEAVSGTVGSLVALCRLGYAAVRLAGRTLSAEWRLATHPTRAQLEAAAGDLTRLGWDLADKAEEITDVARAGLRVLELLWRDGRTRHILRLYLTGLRSTTPYLDRQAEPAELVINVGLGELAALKAAEAGRAVGAAASADGFIGRFTCRAIEELGELARLLEKRRASVAEDTRTTHMGRPARRPPDSEKVERWEGHLERSRDTEHSAGRPDADVATSLERKRLRVHSLGAARQALARSRKRLVPDSGPQIANLRTISSKEANAPFITDTATAQGWYPPYAEGPGVRTFTTADDLSFVRVHTEEGNAPGGFLVRQDEIAHLGNDPEAIQNYLGLKDTPAYISDVTVPAGTRMQTAIIGPQPNFGLTTNSGIQYQLLDRIPLSSFSNTRPLK